ncbi:glycosyltransferase family 4 protein [Rapidithrix thailandica]|uniref:Glycosyltransferase family 4 protein n=1 Tax=Rapidithrix thailandica TaxID=413964 RepID=A0AAW9S1T8_9BACT
MRKEIVFINQNSGYLMIDIINAYLKRGFTCSLITGRVITRNNPLPSNVKLEKTIAYDRSSTLKRLFTWTVGALQMLWIIKTKYRKAELFIVSNPPFATFLPLFCKNSFRLLIFDVYPDTLLAYKIFKTDSFLIQMWKKANKRIFAQAHKVYTLSKGMKDLLKQYITSNQIEIVPIWTDNSFLKPLEKKENLFIKKYNLHDKFLVMYSGNLGRTHPVEVLLDVAKIVSSKKVFFVIIGEGEKKVLLEKKKVENNLSNCLILPFQTTEFFPYSLSAADLGVVTLGEEASKLSVPSKTFNLMSVGAPILAIAGQDSELHNLIDQYNIGQTFQPNEVKAIGKFIDQLASDHEQHLMLREKAVKATNFFGPDNAERYITE